EASTVLEGARAATRRATARPPHYGTRALAFVPVPEGRHSLAVTYRYDDGSTYGGVPPEGPWATLRIERGRGPGNHEPGAVVLTAAPRWPWRALAALGDAAIGALAGSLLLFYAGLLWRGAGLPAVVGGGGPVPRRFFPQSPR